MRLTSGSETNIKPELVMQAFYAFCENELEPYSYQIHRMQMIFQVKGRIDDDKPQPDCNYKSAG